MTLAGDSKVFMKLVDKKIEFVKELLIIIRKNAFKNSHLLRT